VIFHFLNLDRLGTDRNRSGPVRPVPTVSGPVPTGSVNPACVAACVACVGVPDGQKGQT
jgi:hypothetical protein